MVDPGIVLGKFDFNKRCKAVLEHYKFSADILLQTH